MTKEPFNWGPVVVIVGISLITMVVAYMIALGIARVVTGAVGL